MKGSICLPKSHRKTECSDLLKGVLRRDLHCYHNHPGMKNVDGQEHTAALIKIVVNWWKILNVKSVGVDVRFNNKLQAVAQDPLDERLNTILQFGEIALQMKDGQGKRYKQFTRDTAQAKFVHVMVLSVCPDLCSESRIIMFHGEHFQQIP